MDYLYRDQWQPFIETRWAKTGDRRSLIVIHLDPRRNRLALRSIPDRSHLIRN